ncbi:MAG: hypothetical protein P4L45_02255, partial [Ignavibacteriaceae bacterium]|nr:hypothetical protein [Ignavibacteriaceae bacterium]
MQVFVYKSYRYKIGVLIFVLFYFIFSLSNVYAQSTQAQTQPSIIDNVGWHTLFIRHPGSAQIKSFANSGFNKMIVPGYYPGNTSNWVSDMSVIDSFNNYNIHSIIYPNDTCLVPAFTKKHLGSLLANGTITYMAVSLDSSVKKWTNRFGRDGVAGIEYDIEEVPGTMLYQVSAPKNEIDEIDGIKIFLSQDSTDDKSPLGYTSGYDKIAQVFHPTYHYLGHVTLKAK